MRVRTRTTIALTAAIALAVTGCEDQEPDEAAEPATDQETDEADGSEDPDDDATDDWAAEDEAEPEAAATVGSVTLAEQTVELDEAFWCEDHESQAGRTDMRIVGIANGAIKLDAGSYEADGVTRDAVAIWEGEQLDRGLGGTSLVAVEDGDEGYPWIEVDGTHVSIDGSFVGDDDPEDADPVSFSADLEVEEEPRGSAFC